MPPSRHSSSSHRSSSRHSSHHSSSSHSSRSSSSVSRHSSSSHSSASHVYRRPRTNQPTGFHHTSSGHTPTMFYCRKHDYAFYDADWTDPESGTFYRQGYYDENGEYYNRVIFDENAVIEHNYLCEYCGSTVVTTESGNICPHCGSAMKEHNNGVILDSFIPETTSSSSGKTMRKGVVPVICLVLFFFATFCMGGGFTALSVLIGAITDSGTSGSGGNTNEELFGSVINLKKIDSHTYCIVKSGDPDFDKSLVWHTADQAYYDSDTDCYFWYNTDVTPYVWQYWYEGISSDYGDYGWMEYEDSGDWYIERTNGNWVILPDQYDTSYLWHISD